MLLATSVCFFTGTTLGGDPVDTVHFSRSGKAHLVSGTEVFYSTPGRICAVRLDAETQPRCIAVDGRVLQLALSGDRRFLSANLRNETSGDDRLAVVELDGFRLLPLPESPLPVTGSQRIFLGGWAGESPVYLVACGTACATVVVVDLEHSQHTPVAVLQSLQYVSLPMENDEVLYNGHGGAMYALPLAGVNNLAKAEFRALYDGCELNDHWLRPEARVDDEHIVASRHPCTEGSVVDESAPIGVLFEPDRTWKVIPGAALPVSLQRVTSRLAFWNQDRSAISWLDLNECCGTPVDFLQINGVGCAASCSWVLETRSAPVWSSSGNRFVALSGRVASGILTYSVFIADLSFTHKLIGQRIADNVERVFMGEYGTVVIDYGGRFQIQHLPDVD